MTEPRRSRDAFDRYWGLGAERSIERLHAELALQGKAPHIRTLYGWSSRYHWQHRIRDLEREAAAAEDERRVREVREMRERQLREGLLLQQRGTEWLSQLDGDRVTGSDAIRAITEGARLEREARGDSDESGQRAPGRDHVRDRLAELTDEQLEALTEGLKGQSDGS